MQFIKVTDQVEASTILIDEVTKATDKNQKVLWLVSGGSNIEIFAAAFNKLSQLQKDKLTIMLSDERFGDVDHPDSNYFKLKNAGVDFTTVNSIPVLTSSVKDFDSTVMKYNDHLEETLNESDFVIAQIGIGTDGHTLGILPNSSAVNNDKEYVFGYTGPDFQRITMTFFALRKVNKTLVFCLGIDKSEALINLRDKDLSLEEEPAQIFKDLNEVYIINSTIGDK
jgi:6-phosphogluconolactonase/glucosamine-6-phosphate isomerase/deaminase